MPVGNMADKTKWNTTYTNMRICCLEYNNNRKLRNNIKIIKEGQENFKA